MKFLWPILCIIFLALPAFAADPECVSPVVYDEAVHGEYDATATVRFCTPAVDVDGYPIADGDITQCTFTAAGQPFVITTSTNPQQYIVFPVPQIVRDMVTTGSIEVFCENTAGQGEAAVALNARFRFPAAPSVGVLLR